MVYSTLVILLHTWHAFFGCSKEGEITIVVIAA
jgi:hypothetical protein